MDAQNLKIDVIAVCNADGTLEPLRFRYEDETHRLRRVCVTEVLCCKPIQYVGIEATVYLCRATVREKRWLFELKYTIRTHTWSLQRKVC